MSYGMSLGAAEGFQRPVCAMLYVYIAVTGDCGGNTPFSAQFRR